jgi:uncharacterized protein YcfL
MMKRLSGYTSVLLIILGFVLSGCASNSVGISVESATQRVVFGSSRLSSHVQVEDIATVDVGGNTKGIVKIKSLSTAEQHLQYRFYWYDENGLEVDAKPSAWQQIMLRGKDVISLSGVSVSPQGTQFRIQISELK